MMSLWSLLVPRPPIRCFALLDAMGVCRALREGRHMPSENGWVVVHELRSNWLGQTLPVDAIVEPRYIGKRPRPALAA